MASVTAWFNSAGALLVGAHPETNTAAVKDSRIWRATLMDHSVRWQPVRDATMVGTCPTSVLTEAEGAISALCGGARGYADGLGMSGRVNVLTVPIHVMAMFDELRFICARRNRISSKYCSRSDNR